MDISHKPILDCLDDESATEIVTFVSVALEKGAQGGVTDVISLTEDVHAFYNKIPSSLK